MENTPAADDALSESITKALRTSPTALDIGDVRPAEIREIRG